MAYVLHDPTTICSILLPYIKRDRFRGEGPRKCVNKYMDSYIPREFVICFREKGDLVNLNKIHAMRTWSYNYTLSTLKSKENNSSLKSEHSFMAFLSPEFS